MFTHKTMKIKYIKHKQIDKYKWDNCIKNAKNGLIYGYSWYLDIVSPKWEALVSDDYEFIMALPAAKKHLLSYLYQPVFFQKISLFSEKEISTNIINEFLNSIPKKFLIIDISLNHNLSELDTKYNIKKRTNYELDLNKNYNKLYKNYSKKHRRNLRKVNEIDYKFKESTDITKFIEIKKSDIKFPITKNKTLYISKIEKIFTYSFAKNIGKLFFAISPENEYLSAIFVLKIENHILKFTARTPEGRKKGLNYFMHDKIIEYYSNQNLIFDFIGSDIEGVARFNKGFGSEMKHYYSIHKRLF